MKGDELKAFRRSRGWRQRDLAEWLGLDQPAISEMERGMRAVPAEVASRLGSPEAVPQPPDNGGAGTAAGDVQDAAERTDGPTPEAAPGGDVPPRPIIPPEEEPGGRRRPRPKVVPSETELRALEVRVLRMIEGYDAEIMVADPGETQIRRVTQHMPGLADVIGMVDTFDGEIVSANAVALSKAWVNVARENQRVRMVLETLTAGGAWRDAFAATAPVILAILLNHGLLPSLPGLMVARNGEPGYDAADVGGGSSGNQPGWRETAAGSVG